MIERKRHWIVEPDPNPISGRGLGRADHADLRLAYPASPLYGGGSGPAYASDSDVINLFTSEVLVGVVDDGGHTFGAYDRDYAGGGAGDPAPNLQADVPTGGGGLPGTPWAPNIASPADGQNPASIPAVGADLTSNAKPANGGPFVGSTLTSPHETTVNIVAQNREEGSLKFGESDGT